MPAKISRLLAPLFLIGCVLIFLFPVIFQNKIFAPPGFGLGDYTLGVLPNAFLLGDALKNGRFPLWSPAVEAGYPFAASGEAGPFFPPNWLFALFPIAQGQAFYALFTFLTLALATFFLARSFRLSRQASLISSLSLTFATGLTVRIIHLPVLGIFAFLPLSFLLAQKYFRQPKFSWLIWLTIVLALQILAYNPQTTLICFTAFGLFWIYLTITATPQKTFRPLASLIFILVFSLLLSACQLLPGIQLLGQTARRTGLENQQAFQYPFHFQELAYFFQKTPFGDPSLATYQPPFADPGIFWENHAYTGLAALLLATLALVFAFFKNRSVFFFGLLLIFSLLLSLGPLTPVGFLLRLPPFSFFRIPGRFVLLAMFAAALLAGFGFDWLSQKWAAQRKWFALVAAALILADLYPFARRYNPTVPAAEWLQAPQTARFISQDPSFFRIEAIGNYEAYLQVYRQFGGWQNSLAPYSHLREGLPPNLGVIWGLNYATGATALPPQRFTEWQNTFQANVNPNLKSGTASLTPLALKMLQLKNVKYLLSGFQINQADLDIKETISHENLPAFFLYEVRRPLPHALIIHQARQLPADKILATIGTKSFDPQKEILLEETFPLLPAAAAVSQATVIDCQPEQVKIKAQTNQPGFLLLTDTNSFGWQATDNGQPTQVYQADYLFRAIRLDSGEHEVIFTYRPAALRLGVIISLASLGIWAFLGVALLLRRVRNS